MRDCRGEGQAGADSEQNPSEYREAYWWQFCETRPALYAAIDGLERVLGHAHESVKHFAFTFLPSRWSYSHNA